LTVEPMNDGVYWCTSCSCKASVTAGTVFKRTRKPLTDWFRVAANITTPREIVLSSASAGSDDL